MKKHVKEFWRRVNDEIGRSGSDTNTIHQAIESAYDACIVTNEIPKSVFLSALLEQDKSMFSTTVDHLFMPVKWTKVKLRTLYAIKNTATGNLLTLERDAEEETFNLKESSEETDRLDYAPMLTGDEEDAKMFVKMLKEVPSDAPLGINETMISLDIDEKINVMNLETTEVRVIF
jgi:hypothetical protein